MTQRLAYFDTSVLLKRYRREPGSAQAVALLRRYQVLTSALAPVEATSALVRRRAVGEIRPADFEAIAAQLSRDRQHWHLVEVTADVLSRAEDVIAQANVCTLDAVHMATALAVETAWGGPRRQMAFVTGEGRQQDAAWALGLSVVWVR